ncbi:MAG: hypothetical protein JWM49_2028 [Microbacteriaceae bacterium]|nr:hypothetical protein [Microbacteriaceae bacterium]
MARDRGRCGGGSDYAGVSAKAKGDVKDRIGSLVDVIDGNPDGIRGFLFTGPAADEYEAKLKRVGQACSVAGVDVAFSSN